MAGRRDYRRHRRVAPNRLGTTGAQAVRLGSYCHPDEGRSCSPQRVLPDGPASGSKATSATDWNARSPGELPGLLSYPASACYEGSTQSGARSAKQAVFGGSAGSAMKAFATSCAQVCMSYGRWAPLPQPPSRVFPCEIPAPVSETGVLSVWWQTSSGWREFQERCAGDRTAPRTEPRCRRRRTGSGTGTCW